ncbi:MAG: hypothetical protein OXT64_14000 [Gammaproteobacteria bacterium]|nr:hypothetical protein [Gammaproteobacteria bacterium]
MKKLEEFTTEEVGEEWLRELYKVVAMRRGTMFRLITESTRMLLYGNAGGAALVVGFMREPSGSPENTVYHWFSLLTLVVFGLGILASALTMVLVTLVSVKEAHGAETGLKEFVDGDLDRTRVLFTVAGQVFRLADFATVSGTVSALSFMLGGLSSIVLLTLYF